MKVVTCLLFTLLVAFGAEANAGATAAPSLPAQTGIAVTPRNFPAHTPADVDEAFKLTRKLGRYAVFIYQWRALELDVARAMVQRAKKVGLQVILALSPTTLGEGRKELDVPAGIRRQAGADISFANPVIREGYKRSARALARLQPSYLCLATEINFLALQRLDEYLQFASLYKETYREVKRISPGSKVFVSFQWEWMRIVDAKEPHKIREHSKVIDILRPELDAIALTSYPAPFHEAPAVLPADYYTWLQRHSRTSDEVLFMEVGWPTEGSGSEREQQAFIERLPALLERLPVSIVAWALLHDVAPAPFDANLRSVGLITGDGRRKLGYRAFRALRQRAR